MGAVICIAQLSAFSWWQEYLCLLLQFHLLLSNVHFFLKCVSSTIKYFNSLSDQGYCVDKHFPTFLLVLSYESFSKAHLKAESEIHIPKKSKLPPVYDNVWCFIIKRQVSVKTRPFANLHIL